MSSFPFKQKLEAAVQAWLATGISTGTTVAGVTIINSYGAQLGDDPASPATQPAYPFIAVIVTSTADDFLPGVYHYRIDLEIAVDASLALNQRQLCAQIAHDLQALMLRPVDDSSPITDANPQGGAFMAFANLTASPDTRPAAQIPLHVYGLWLQSDAQALTQADHEWQATLTFAGTGQTMDKPLS